MQGLILQCLRPPSPIFLMRRVAVQIEDKEVLTVELFWHVTLYH